MSNQNDVVSIYTCSNDNPTFPKLGVRVLRNKYFQFFVGGQQMFVLDLEGASSLAILLDHALNGVKSEQNTDTDG